MQLYEITAKYHQLLGLVDDPEIPEEALTEALQDIQDSLAEKLNGIGALIRQAETEAEALEAEQARLKRRANVRRNRVARLKLLAKRGLGMLNQPSIDTGKFKYTVTRPTTHVVTNDSLPDEWCRIEKRPDKTRIAVALKAGETIPGAWLEYGEPGLRIS